MRRVITDVKEFFSSTYIERENRILTDVIQFFIDTFASQNIYIRTYTDMIFKIYLRVNARPLIGLEQIIIQFVRT